MCDESTSLKIPYNFELAYVDSQNRGGWRSCSSNIFRRLLYGMCFANHDVLYCTKMHEL